MNAERKNKSTGPRSCSGKASSSMNRLSHGCRSRVLILPCESEEDFNYIHNGWYDEFQPDSFYETELVDTLIENHWFFRRAMRCLNEAEAAAEDARAASAFTKEHEHQVTLKLRYKTTAERAFYRSLNFLRQMRKDLMQIQKDNRLLQNANDSLRAELERRGPAQPVDVLPNQPQSLVFASKRKMSAKSGKTKNAKPKILDQWIEVEIVDGKTVIGYYPSNEELWAQAQKMNPPPTLVYRRFNFVDAVPPEYAWTTSDPKTMERGGMGIQRMTVETWLRVIEEEKVTGRPGKCGGNLPKPEAWGHCDCPSCTANRERLKAAGQ